MQIWRVMRWWERLVTVSAVAVTFLLTTAIIVSFWYAFLYGYIWSYVEVRSGTLYGHTPIGPQPYLPPPTSGVYGLEIWRTSPFRKIEWREKSTKYVTWHVRASRGRGDTGDSFYVDVPLCYTLPIFAAPAVALTIVAMRRARRVYVHQCLCCDYSLGAEQRICPECGTSRMSIA